MAPGPVPAWLDDLVLACLAKDPAARPPDAAAIARAMLDHEVVPAWTNADAGEWWQTNVTMMAPATAATSGAGAR